MSAMGKIVLDLLCHADFSGRIRPSREDIGFPAFSAGVARLRAQNPEGTLLLDAGDAFSTNYWPGLPLVGAMIRSKTDVMTLGNHEFDRGPAFLDSCISACPFPVLCANVRRKADGAPVPGTKPWGLLERCGIRIGVLGLTTEYTPYMVEKSAFAPFEMTSAAEAAARHIPAMRAAGADVVVVLTHMPFYQAADGTLTGELPELIDASPAADVWIGGHIPGDCAQVRNGACVVKAGFGGASIAHVRLTLDAASHRILDRSCAVVQTDPNGQADPEITRYIRSVTDPFEPYFREPLGSLNERWRMTLAHESKLGDFLADCLRFGGQTELSYMNTTSACGELLPGEITREELLYCAAFDDEMFTGIITGAQLHALLEAVYEPERFGNNAAIAFSGFHAAVDHTRPGGQKVLSVTRPDGTPIAPDERLSVTVSAYMASGGNDTGAIAGQIDWKPTGRHYHEAVSAYAKSLGVLTVADYPRLRETGEPENNHAPY